MSRLYLLQHSLDGASDMTEMSIVTLLIVGIALWFLFCVFIMMFLAGADYISNKGEEDEY